MLISTSEFLPMFIAVTSIVIIGLSVLSITTFLYREQKPIWKVRYRHSEIGPFTKEKALEHLTKGHAICIIKIDGYNKRQVFESRKAFSIYDYFD